METVMLPSIPTSKVGVSDVISSVRSIMASEMAQHEQQQEKVVVIQAQSPSTGKQKCVSHFIRTIFNYSTCFR
jgi:ABC-type branched-subunit amino acid transport system substrate-binding protein